jgi:hypothetical protein
MFEHERIFSAISSYVSKLSHVELKNDVRAGTMTVAFHSNVPSEGTLVALKVYGTRNVEITVSSAVNWHNFRRYAHVYSQALALLDCFHLIEFEHAEPEAAGTGEGGSLRIAHSAERSAPRVKR